MKQNIDDLYEDIKCKCDKCNKIWITNITSLTKDDKPTGCPHCNLGKTEKRINND